MNAEGADLEPGPEGEVDAVQVVIQAGDAPLVHDELVVVVDAYHEQQTQDVPGFLQTTSPLACYCKHVAARQTAAQHGTKQHISHSATRQSRRRHSRS